MKVLLAVFSLLMLCAVVCAQTPQAKRRARRGPKPQPTTMRLELSAATVTIPCVCGRSYIPCSPHTEQKVLVHAEASHPDGDNLKYSYQVTGGRLVNVGNNVYWYLDNLKPGRYSISAFADDGHGHKASSSASVRLAICTICDCFPCPAFNITGPEDSVEEGQQITFTANLSAGEDFLPTGYTWTISSGTIIKGQGTTSITVDTTGAGGKDLEAVLNLAGIDPSCSREVSYRVKIGSKD